MGGDITQIKRKTYMADMFVPEYDGNSNVKLKNEDNGLYTAVAVVGDQFWNKGRTREFCMAEALERDFKTMNFTFHNLDHAQRIQDLVGTHINTEYDKENKRMVIHIKPYDNMPAYNIWRSFLAMCKDSGQTPNVSIEALVSVENVKASDLPEGTDYKQFGIEDDDMVEVERGYNFVGAATVIRGACSDSDGCGIDVNEASFTVCNCEDDTMVEEKEEIIEEVVETVVVDEPVEVKTKAEETDVVIALKEKLVKCGDKRKDIESERSSLEEYIVLLEEKLKSKDELLKQTKEELNKRTEELSKPVTKKSTETKNENWRVDALKKIMGRD